MRWVGSACRGSLFGAFLLSTPAFSVAQGADTPQTVAHGQVNWTERTITATGSGAPSLKAPNAAVARLGAERAAKMEALRNILEAVKGIRVSGQRDAGAVMGSSGEIRSKVEGVVRNFKVLDTKYYSDGGVDVIVQVPLDGVLGEALVPSAGKKARQGDPPSDSPTGVVVNAKGLGVSEALAPRLLNESGAEIFGAAAVTKDAVRKHGAVGYSKSLDQALASGRVADKPLVVRAIRLSEPGSSDLVVSKEDAAKLVGLGGVFGAGRVVIVTD